VYAIITSIDLFHVIGKGLVSTEVDFIPFEKFTSKGITIDSFDILHMKGSGFRFTFFIDFYDIVILEGSLKPFFQL
jgi:hypothetical protein